MKARQKHARGPAKRVPISGSAVRPAGNGPLFTRHQADYANGDRYCQARNDRIDRVICIIQSERMPCLCSGCRYADAPGARKEEQ